MGPEHEPGEKAAQPPSVERAGPRTHADTLTPSPESASADDLEVYPHDRFLRALEGRMTMSDFGADALQHVENRLARRRRSPAQV